MTESGLLRVAVVGVGRMGRVYARELALGKVRGAVLAAVCDPDTEALAGFAEVPGFHDSQALIRSGALDALVIATPHYQHVPISVEALSAGLHVLTDKPLGVHKAECERALGAYAERPRREQVFGEILNYRFDPRFRKLRSLIQSGELGQIWRINWTITDWFRTDAYYRSSSWRATWRGEGGGVLVNQAPHNLDLWQWLFGMPARLRAFCGFGRFHAIEVEDQVTAYLEYPSGATGVFITSTGEAPGTNRLEVAGDGGKVVLEAGDFTFVRNEVPASEYCRTGPERAGLPPVSSLSLPISESGPNHTAVLQNFVSAALGREELVAPAMEGIHAVELANAMIYSELMRETVELPLDGVAFARELERLIQEPSAADSPRRGA